MKSVVLYADSGQKTTAKELAKALSKGIQQQGAECDLIDVKRDGGTRIAMYQYVAIIATPTSLWGGKIDPVFSSFLRQNGSVAGKRCSAFVSKHSIRKTKTLQALFKVMEQEGMYLTYSDILTSASQAQVSGTHLKLT